jgi:hypothetical protein
LDSGRVRTRRTVARHVSSVLLMPS